MTLGTAKHWLWTETKAVLLLLPVAIAILVILTQWPLSDVEFLYVDL